MKNNRGITLVELIISISLISIVILFLFRLLVDVRYNKNKVDYARDNQQSRAMIMKSVQDDLLTNKLIRLSAEGSTSSKLKITFTFNLENNENIKSILIVTNKSVSYTNISEQTEKWTLPDSLENAYYQTKNILYKRNFDENSDYFSIWFRIPLIVKKDSENTIDDLEFFYIGKTNDINFNNFPSTGWLND